MVPTPQRPTPVAIDAAVRAAFIAALRDCGMVGVAAKRAGASRFALHRQRRIHPGFAEDWDAIVAPQVEIIDPAKLEAALFRRFVRGVKRRRLYRGEVIDTYRDYQDREALRFLAMLMPEKFGEATTIAAPPVVMTREEFIAALDAVPIADETPPVTGAAVAIAGAAPPLALT